MEEHTDRPRERAERISSLEQRLQELSEGLTSERSHRRSLAVEKLMLERELKSTRAAMEHAAREHAEELAAAAEEARRIAGSRSWRLGHGILRVLRRLFFRPALRRGGAPEALAERLERQVEAAGRTGRADEAVGRKPSPSTPQVTRRIELRTSDLERIAGRPPVSVVVPIYNAAPQLRRCLEAIRRNSRGLHELILINDASTDPEIERLLTGLRDRPGIRVLRNDTNLGFTATVNRGFELVEGDVAILNSDTEVTPGWLGNLAFAAYSSDLVGTVTPLSDNAGAFSAPVIGARNPLPVNLPLDEIGRQVTRGSDRLYPELPIGGGYCMYVRRELLDEIGGLDADRFPSGYGAENDFCMRAGRMGWRNLVDDATIVFHERQASFGDRKAELSADSRRRINELHPDYTERIREFHSSPELGAARKNVERSFRSDPDHAGRMRILFVVHGGKGGTPATTLDLARALSDRYEPYLLTSDTRSLVLHQLEAEELVPVEQISLEPRWKITDLTRDDYREFVASILVSYGIELVHVRNLIKHTFDLPGIAASLGIPLVFSFHDYYLTCPTVHLLDQDLNYCAGRCTPGDGECFTPSALVRGTPPLKHRWVHRWRDAVNSMIEHADALVTTSEHAREVLRGALTQVRERPVELIEHGRDLEQASGLAAPPTPGGPIRILVPGNLNVNKGAELIRSLLEVDADGRLEFHFAGEMRGPFEGLGSWHGPYERDEFPSVVAGIRPSFIATLSITGETYSHVLTEAWAAGVPVIACDIGTFRERVTAHGGGFLIDHRDPGAAYRRIIEVADDPAAYRELAGEADLHGIPTTAAMAGRYEAIYARVLATGLPALSARRQDPAANGGDPGSRSNGHRRGLPTGTTVGMILVGEGEHPPSSYVRCLRPLCHSSAQPDLRAFPLALDDYIAGAAETDAVLVQRNAIPPGRLDEFLERLRANDDSLVLELDDNLVDFDVLDEAHAARRADVETVRAVATASDLTVTSTRPLAEAVAPYASRVEVVPNMLDELLWMPAYGEAAFGEQSDVEPPLTALYMGSSTHGADIAMLQPVVEELRRRGLPVELEVIGGLPEEDDGDWLRRLPVPRGVSTYPRFARWLRSEARRWQLALAPLRDTPFNRSKSDLKFLEYSALGLPGVYSAIGVYDDACEHGERGLLATNTVEAWVNACEPLIRDARLRRELGGRAYDYVVRHRRLAVASPYAETVTSLRTSGRSIEESTSAAVARR